MTGLTFRSALSSFTCSSSPPMTSKNMAFQNLLDTSSPRFSSDSKSIVPTETRLSRQASRVHEMPKSQEDLRKEIAWLEFEIVHMEQYLLSLYRKAYEEPVLSLTCPSRSCPSMSLSDHFFNKFDQKSDQIDEFRYHEPFSSPQGYPSLKAFSAREGERRASGTRCLGDLLGSSNIIENIINPNRLSEDIIRCISSVYCALSSSVRTDTGFSASSKTPCHDSLNLHYNKDITLNPHFVDHQDVNMSYAVVVDALKLQLDDGSFNQVALALQNFRSLAQDLEKVDLSRMKREEKLAFWINIHNALVMHAYLAYGIHTRSSIMKAAYDVGGHRVNPYIIQSSILGIRPHYTAPLLQTLFSPSRKSKTCSIRHIFALDYPEPLAHFTLSSGTYTDPPVRVYTADTIFWDLRQAKEEYIRENVQIHKGTKLLLPKIMYYYMKDMSLDMSGLVEATFGCLSEAAKRTALNLPTKDIKRKGVQWLPENSNFRYVMAGELVRERFKTR